MIHYGKHSIDDDDIASVVSVLQSEAVTQGQIVPEFEMAIARYTRAQYAVAANSGTSALHAACHAIGIGPDSLVWTVPNSFAASANAARYCGAQVDFVDIDPHTQNICLEHLSQKLICAERNNALPDALIVVHFAGFPVALKDIAELAKQYQFRIIEDAAHALGASYGSTKIGDCTYSDACVFSFHPVKTITSVEGGMVCTNDKGIAQRARLLINHGITRDSHTFAQPSSPWYYEQQDLGHNYRLSDVHAALGLNQCNKIDQFVQYRRALARQYQQRFSMFSELAIDLPQVDIQGESAHHLFVIRVEPDQQLPMYQYMKAHGILLNVHYLPIHLHPYYRRLGFAVGMFPNAENHAKTALTLPLHVLLNEADIEQIVRLIRSFYRFNTKKLLNI